ncbi:MAG: LEM-3-like GIY-YIG domain-containing protein [Solirubrobacterales bacterium]
MTRPVLSPTLSTGSRDPLSFLPGVSEKLGHYVYALRDPLEDGRIFYVGKGTGDRVYAHARHAKRVDASKTSAQLKLARIREIHAAELDVGVELIRHNMKDEAEAFEVEAAVIDVLKIAGIELANVVAGQGTERGWRPLDEIMAEYAAQPVEIGPEHRVLLIRLNRAQWLAPGDLYEKTRASWKVAPERRKPEWVFVVYDGIVRAVYKIESWERPPKEKLVGKRVGRWDFNGVRDLTMEDLYLWADVSGYLRRGAQNPITYVHCD